MNVRTDNEHPYRRWLAAAGLLLLAALLLPGQAAAATAVGRVISANGDVTAVRAGESARSLSRGDAVHEGDEIRTGPAGRAQIRFVDEGLFNLSPATRFAVDRYRAADEEADTGGSAVLSFLRGALRTITGAIGDGEEDTYRMNTPTATIGVRGTGYALQYCDAAACAAEFGGQPGLYGRVDDGGIRVDTPRGSAEFGAGSYFFVAEGGVPEPILQPPPGILDGGEDEAAGPGEVGRDGDGIEITLLNERDDDGILPGGGEPVFEAGDLFDEAEVKEEVEVTGLVGAGVVAEWSGNTAAELFSDDTSFTTDGDGAVDSATFTSGETTIKVSGANLEDTGAIEDLGVGWGRWNGALEVNNEPESGNMAFTVTDNLTEPTRLGELSGTLGYALAGGPKALDNQGGLWTVGQLGLTVDFEPTRLNPVELNTFEITNSSGTIAATFGITDDSTVDTVNNEIFLAYSNVQGSSGTMTGQFVGLDADGMIVVFAFDSNQTGPVVGTSVLEQIE